MIENIGVANFCTLWVVSLMITNFLEAAVSLLAKALAWSLRRGWLPVLVVISQEHCSRVPATTAVHLGPALVVVTDTEATVTSRVDWAGANTLVPLGPSRNTQTQTLLSFIQHLSNYKDRR